MTWIFGLYFLVAICLAEENQFNITVCENDENVTMECQDNTAISLMEVVGDNYICNNDTNIECSKNLHETLKSNCHEKKKCILSTESLFPIHCQKAAKYLKINYTCICNMFKPLATFHHIHSACTTSLSEMTCSTHVCPEPGGGIKMNITSITIMESLDLSYCSTCNMEELKQSVIEACNSKKTCSHSTLDKFCLFHQRYASIKYQCKENQTSLSQESPDATVQEMSNQITAESINVGIIVGITIGVLVVICIALMTMILLRRSKRCSQNQQNKQVQSYQNGTYAEDHSRAEIGIVTEDNTVTSTFNKNKFTSEPSAMQRNKKEPLKSNLCMTNSNQSFNSYFTLDPNETERDKKNTSTVPYSEIKHEIKPDKQEWYKLNEDGVYDKAFSKRHKEDATNIYSHSFEEIYDVSNKNDRHFERDETYDHFGSGKSEDDCDTNSTYRYAANSENDEMLL